MQLKRGHDRHLVLPLIHRNEAGDSRMKWLPPGLYIIYAAMPTSMSFSLALKVSYLLSSTSRVVQVPQIMWHLNTLLKESAYWKNLYADMVSLLEEQPDTRNGRHRGSTLVGTPKSRYCRWVYSCVVKYMVAVCCFIWFGLWSVSEADEILNFCDYFKIQYPATWKCFADVNTIFVLCKWTNTVILFLKGGFHLVRYL